MIWSSIFLSADLRLRPIWRALLFLPLFVLLAIPLVIVSTLVAGPDRVQDNQEVGFIVQGVVLTVAPLLAGWILLRLLDRRSFRTLGLWFYDGWGRELLWGLAGGLGLMSVLVGALVALGQVHLSFASLDARSVLLGLGWNVVVFLGAAAGEEILFRGYPFQRLVESWGAFAAVFVLSALFGWGHLSNPSATPLSTANTVLMGILLALTYLKTRALWFPFTGSRLGAADALYCGVATHHVPRELFPDLAASLAEERRAVDETIAGFAADPGPPPLAEHRAAIDRCFAGGSVAEILAALKAEGGGWAENTLATLAAKSPTSLAVTYRQLREGTGLDFAAAMRLEYRLSQRFCAGHDFAEGVRAVVIDKDAAPKWRPDRLDAVTPAAVDAYFAPLAGGDLVL